ncbi:MULTISPECIES: hypothetical protein [Clostridium]|uniref:Uncharacterized protein n=3 Tax=Clostridium TaxID=1485 RepID=A0A166RLF8_9CLOT|nr:MULTISPECIES: hypothetical protein [Clostridium]ADK14916.1 hypothetical protein CLJU_c18540 [Clostridium ljungdahlii DSM 13528]ALU38295.1 Hypothetical protein CLAU_3868 [Clostridium autoethanogenum DSM 10061]OAA87911.1 hypothetical protein WX45_03395 [Clostridium ljungdahlii DSM 13528]OAA90907.1 hypothetical protein WY13_00973 [Clostridium ljungdahlii]OAA94115.1 hypothetical protein WX73_03685 [Clostridium coskatii]
MENKTKMRFENIEQRDKQLKEFRTIKYIIDKKNPLIVWIYI